MSRKVKDSNQFYFWRLLEMPVITLLNFSWPYAIDFM